MLMAVEIEDKTSVTKDQMQQVVSVIILCINIVK